MYRYRYQYNMLIFSTLNYQLRINNSILCLYVRTVYYISGFTKPDFLHFPFPISLFSRLLSISRVCAAFTALHDAGLRLIDSYTTLKTDGNWKSIKCGKFTDETTKWYLFKTTEFPVFPTVDFYNFNIYLFNIKYVHAPWKRLPFKSE